MGCSQSPENAAGQGVQDSFIQKPCSNARSQACGGGCQTFQSVGNEPDGQDLFADFNAKINQMMSNPQALTGTNSQGRV